MNEATLQSKFGQFNTVQGVFELKWFDISKTKSIAFSRLAPHQKEALLGCSGSGYHHKIRDTGKHQKPFDCFNLAHVQAYVVVVVYEPRKRKDYYYVTINDWIQLESESNRKSATEPMLQSVATYIERK